VRSRGRVVSVRGAFAIVAAAVLVLVVPAAQAVTIVFSQVSVGERKGNGPFGITFRGASADGTHVFFETNEQLTNDDTDTTTDVYEHSGDVTTLVSKGGTGGYATTFAGATPDGLNVFLETADSLTPDDTDPQIDVYQRSGGVTTRVSKGAVGGNGAFSASFCGASSDGSKVFFRTSEQLTNDDGDSVQDIYQRAAVGP